MKRWIFGCVGLLLLGALVVAKQIAPVNAPKGILRHAAAFNFKPDVPQAKIDAILAETRATLPTIKGATSIIVGPQTNNFTKYKYGMSIDFVDKDAKEAYAKSPQSKRLHEQYKQYVEDEVVIDILSQ